jgi:hypothetical protein
MVLLVSQPYTPNTIRTISTVEEEVGVPTQSTFLTMLNMITINGIDAVIREFGLMDVKTIGGIPRIPEVIGITGVLVVIRSYEHITILVVAGSIAVFIPLQFPLLNQRSTRHMRFQFFELRKERLVKIVFPSV